MFSTWNSWKESRAVLLAASCGLVVVLPVEAQTRDEQRWDDVDAVEVARHRPGEPNICGRTSRLLFNACRFEVRDDARLGAAQCLNLNDAGLAESCVLAVRATRTEANAECGAVRRARTEVCAKLGGAAYDPIIDPANFVAVIDNPYAPFPPSAFRVYEKNTPEGLERIRVEVLPQTREILGVTVTTLRDTVTLDGVLIEDTLDWLAQDKDGNVWYFGEIVQNFEKGMLADLDGSFEAGKAGAKPGLWMKAAPQVGDFYRQEWALGDAEDVVEVVSINARDVVVPFSRHGTGPVLKTEDTTPLSPSAVEYKYYVPGIGFALEVNPLTGERLELVDYGPR